MKYLIILFLIVPTLANAQSAVQKAAQRNDVNNPNKVVTQSSAPTSFSDIMTKFDEAQIADLTIALAYAQAAKDEPAIRCYTTWLQTVRDMATVREQNKPVDDKPQIITTFQKARNLVKMLDTDSLFRMDCAALAADAKKDVRSFISDIISGAALKVLTGGLIP